MEKIYAGSEGMSCVTKNLPPRERSTGLSASRLETVPIGDSRLIDMEPRLLPEI